MRRIPSFQVESAMVVEGVEEDEWEKERRAQTSRQKCGVLLYETDQVPQ